MKKSSLPKPVPARVAFIGYGRMGRALAVGAAEAGAVARRRVAVFDAASEAAANARRDGFHRRNSVGEAVRGADLVFLCVKPQQMGDVLQSVRMELDRSGGRACFVSIAAGIPIRRIQAALGAGVAVIRAMPNTPALLLAGASAYSRGRAASPRHARWVERVLSAVGVAVPVSEARMDAVTAVSGSGPAYVFLLAEAMAKAGERLGLPAKIARALVHRTIYGAGTMLARRAESAAELRAQVTSPGGTTEAALRVLENRAFRAALEDAVRAAAKRSGELSRA